MITVLAGAPIPKIGISACFFHADAERRIFKGMTLQYIEQNVAHWLAQRRTLPLMIPSPDGSTRRSQSTVSVADYATELDALVLMGGADVCPASYGEVPIRPEWNGDRIRDDYEIALLHAFRSKGKPVLGLCRGAQVINVALGGTLYQDITLQVPGSLNHRYWEIYADNLHATRILPGTGLARLYPEHEVVKTNSIHHQGVKDLGRDLAVEARSIPDGIVEAIRWSGDSYLFGIQWHPEFHDPGDRSIIDDTPILDEFLAAAAASPRAR